MVALTAISGASFSSVAKNQTKVGFKELNLTSPYEITHPVMAANVLPNSGTELIVMSVDEQKLPWMIVYGYQQDSKTYSIVDRVQIPQQYFSFDLTDPEDNAQQSIYFMSPSQIVKYVGNSKSAFEKLKPLANIESIFLKENNNYLTRGRFIRRLNDDDVDDFIVPNFNNVNVLIGQENGEVKGQTLPVSPYIRIFDNGTNFRETQLHITDTNLDNKLDIVRVENGNLVSYLQQEDGSFSQTPALVAIDNKIQGRDWWEIRDSKGDSLDQSDLKYRRLEKLRDINNDGVADMIVRFTQSSGVLDKSNDYEVYLGENKQGKLSFSEQPNSVIKADGTLTGLEFVDIDNDQNYEVLLSGFDIGLGQIIGALLSGSIDQNVFLFTIDEQGNYGKKPNISREVELSFSLTKGQSGSPVIELADVNGDNLKDLILSQGDDKLKLYLGEQGSRAFSKRSTTVKTKLPKDGATLFTQDLNDDGKADILMKYSLLDDAKLARAFKVLLAK